MKRLGVLLFLLALALCQIFIGGARMVYCLPVYGVIGAVAIWVGLPRWKPAAGASSLCLWTTLLFCAYLLGRCIWSPVEYLARHDLLLIAAALAVYLLTAQFFARPAERLLIFYGLLVLALAQVVIGVVQFRTAGAFMPFGSMLRIDRGWRASGFYISPNHYAGMLEVIALLAASVTFWSARGMRVKILTGYLTLCCVVGLAFSGSRGGYVSLFAGGLCLLALSLWACRTFYVRTWSLMGIGAIVAALALPAITLSVMFESQVLHKRVALIGDTGNMRIHLWEAAWKQFDLNRVWGTGAGTYLYYGREFRGRQVFADPIWVHNDYLHLLAEYGAVGMGLFVLFLSCHWIRGLGSTGALARQAQAIALNKSDALALHIGSLSAVAAYMAHSVVDFNLHVPANALLMAFVFGMIANPGLTAGAPGWWLRVTGRGMRAALFCLSALLVVSLVRWMPGEWLAESARRALRDGRFADSRQLAAQSIAYDNGNPEVFYYGGESARILALAEPQSASSGTLLNQALELFTQGLKLFPADSRTLVRLAAAYTQSTDFDNAREVIEQALEIDPDSAHVHHEFGNYYFAQGQLKEAEEEYFLALQLASGGKKESREALNAVRQLLKNMPKPAAELPPVEELEEPGEPAIDAVKIQ